MRRYGHDDLYWQNACRAFGIDPNAPDADERLSYAQDMARPCMECGSDEPRSKRWICDTCIASRKPRPKYTTPARVGAWRADGLGCVERIHPVEVAWEERYG